MNVKQESPHSSGRMLPRGEIDQSNRFLLLFKRGTLQVCGLIYVENGNVNRCELKITDIIVFLGEYFHNISFNICRICAQ